MLIAGRRCEKKIVNKPTPTPLTVRLFLDSRIKKSEGLINGDFWETI
jgi:hypothetical protein